MQRFKAELQQPLKLSSTKKHNQRAVSRLSYLILVCSPSHAVGLFSLREVGEEPNGQDLSEYVGFWEHEVPFISFLSKLLLIAFFVSQQTSLPSIQLPKSEIWESSLNTSPPSHPIPNYTCSPTLLLLNGPKVILITN